MSCQDREVGCSRGTTMGMTNSYTTNNYKKMTGFSLAKKLSQQDIYRINDHGFHFSNYGVQAGKVIQTALDGTDLKNMFARLITNNANMNLLQNVYNNDKERQLWLESYTTNAIITNFGPSTIIVKIYDLLAKADKYYADIEPMTLWNTGLVATRGNTYIHGYEAYFPSSPTDSDHFNRYWKVLNTTTIQLDSGRHHNHHYTSSYTGLLPITKAMMESGDNIWVYRGITVKQLVVVHGLPACAQDAFVTDPEAADEVTIDRAKIGYVTSECYKARLLIQRGKMTTYENELSDVIANYAQQNPDGQGTHSLALANPFGVNTTNAIV